MMRSRIKCGLCLLLLLLMTGCGAALPAAPASVTAERTQEGDIEVRWNPAEGADGYRLYRQDGENGEFRYLTDETGCIYRDATADGTDVCRYRVKALSGGGESAPADSESVLPEPEQHETEAVLRTPVITSVTCVDKYTNVLLFEDAADDGVYEVQRAEAGSGAFTLLGETAEKVYYDQQARGGSYVYRVLARRDGVRTEPSAPAAKGTNPGEVFAVPIFMYHEFMTQEDLDRGMPLDEYAIFQWEFEENLKWLRDNGYTTITTRRLTDYLEGKGSMPEKPVILTVDDGKLGVYRNAYSLLQKYDMKAVFAIIGERIDEAALNPEDRDQMEAPYSTWEELREMEAAGAVEIVSHSYYLHHFDHGNGRFGACSAPEETAEQFFPAAQKDALVMRQKLHEVFNTDTVTFSYPYSVRSEISDAAWRQAGFKLLLAGGGEDVRPTFQNYFVREAGVNAHSSLVRRIVRLQGTPISHYIEGVLWEDRHEN